MAFKTQVRANPFRYDMKEPYGSVSCVFKLWFGTHYIVLKCKALHQALNNYAVQIDRDMRNGVKEGSILFDVIKHIHKGHINMMTCEVMFTSDDPLEILKEEYKLLKAGAEDPKCLNHYHSVSFPSSWISADVVIDYQRWLMSLTQAKKAIKMQSKTVEPAVASPVAKVAKLPAGNAKEAPAKKAAAAKKLPAIDPKTVPVKKAAAAKNSGTELSKTLPVKKVAPVKTLPGRSVVKKPEEAKQVAKDQVRKKSAAAKKKVPSRGRPVGSKDSAPRHRRTKDELLKLQDDKAKRSVRQFVTKPVPKAVPKPVPVPKPAPIGKVSTKGQQPAEAKAGKAVERKSSKQKQ